MSFIEKEISKFLSRPVELYHFNTGVTDWYFTSSDRTISYGGFDWVPETLGRGNIKNSNDLTRSDLTINIAQQNPMRDYFFNDNIQRNLTIKIYRLQIEENEAELVFKGDLGASEVKNELEIYCTFQQIGQFATNNSQRYTYGKKCNHDQYSEKCGLDLAANSITTTAELIIDNEIQIPNGGQLDNTFVGGVIWFMNGILTEKRSINSDDTVSVAGKRILGLDISFGDLLNNGDTIQVAVGCKNDSTECKNLNNFDNFSGFEYIPEDNYFLDGIRDEGKGTSSGGQWGNLPL